MSATRADAMAPQLELPREQLGRLTPISRPGGQGRVHWPQHQPPGLAGAAVVKLYRHPPPAEAASVLADMVAFRSGLDPAQRAQLDLVSAWPLAIVTARGCPIGIVMHDVTARFSVPFVMPSGRRESVLLSLEHLLGADRYLRDRGLDVMLDTVTRTLVAERVSAALAQLHRHAIVASDIAPSNLLVSFNGTGPAICFIDCDSMVFRGRQGLEPVETGDWEMPADFAEPPRTRAADVYKLGLVVLRLFARCHDARSLAPHLRHVPVGVRDLLYRALARDAANRPPAGEWQRALRGLLASYDLNSRHPGPLPRPISHPVAAPVATAAGNGGAARTSGRPAASASQPVSALWLRPAVVVLWMIAGIAVLALILTRLFAGAIPTPSTQYQNHSSGPTAIYRYSPLGDQYYVPGR